MLAKDQPTFLLASHEPALLAAMEPVLSAAGGRVEVVLSAESALVAMTRHPAPALVFIDDSLPGMPLEQLLAFAFGETGGRRFPIVLISSTATRASVDRLQEGVIDDLIPYSVEPSYLKFRIEVVLRAQRLAQEVDALREATAAHLQLDRLTGVYNRESLLSILFRETDRAQRIKNDLCILLLDIDDFGHWNSRLGTEICDNLLRQVVLRIMRLLRSYDVLGRLGKDEFLAVLPGCGVNNAIMLAERLRVVVFGEPFRVGREVIRLSACFGLASSRGRSPVIVLREAEQALALARQSGPETIQCFADLLPSPPLPVTFLSPTSGDELLAW